MSDHMDYRISFSVRSAQRRLDFWSSVQDAIEVTDLRAAAHGQPIHDPSSPVEAAMRTLIRAHIRFAQAQLATVAQADPA